MGLFEFYTYRKLNVLKHDIVSPGYLICSDDKSISLFNICDWHPPKYKCFRE